jgi:hypothetical protein
MAPPWREGPHNPGALAHHASAASSGVTTGYPQMAPGDLPPSETTDVVSNGRLGAPAVVEVIFRDGFRLGGIEPVLAPAPSPGGCPGPHPQAPGPRRGTPRVQGLRLGSLWPKSPASGRGSAVPQWTHRERRRSSEEYSARFGPTPSRIDAWSEGWCSRVARAPKERGPVPLLRNAMRGSPAQIPFLTFRCHGDGVWGANRCQKPEVVFAHRVRYGIGGQIDAQTPKRSGRGVRNRVWGAFLGPDLESPIRTTSLIRVIAERWSLRIMAPVLLP